MLFLKFYLHKHLQKHFCCLMIKFISVVVIHTFVTSVRLKENSMLDSCLIGLGTTLSLVRGGVVGLVLVGLDTNFFMCFEHLEQYHTKRGSFTSFSVTGGRWQSCEANVKTNVYFFPSNLKIEHIIYICDFNP